eukprot:5959721-Alexandrium_andersonii.AAC.1
MSASLVGSEMCIRDRLATKSSWRHNNKKHNITLHERARSRNDDTRQISICLLYTSDAADDM